MEKIVLDEVHIDELLYVTVERGCNELLLKIGSAPCIRFQSGYPLDELEEYEVVRSAQARRMAYDILSNEQIEEFERKRTLEFVYEAAFVSQFDVRMVSTQDGIKATFCRLLAENRA